MGGQNSPSFHTDMDPLSQNNKRTCQNMFSLSRAQDPSCWNRYYSPLVLLLPLQPLLLLFRVLFLHWPFKCWCQTSTWWPHPGLQIPSPPALWWLLFLHLYCISSATLMGTAIDWLLCPPKIHVLKPNPIHDGISGWGFREVIRSWGWNPHEWN